MKKVFSYHKPPLKHIDIKKVERLKICFQFLFVLVLSCASGVILSKSISDSFYANWMFRVSTHFETIFIKCSDVFERAIAICVYSLSDILSVFLIFAVSFFVFNYTLTNVVLFYNGIKFGVSVSFLIEFFKRSETIYSIGISRLILFLSFEFVFLVVLFLYSCKMALSSSKLRGVTTLGRPNIKPKEFFLSTVKTLAYIGVILILNSSYCFLLYFSK